MTTAMKVCLTLPILLLACFLGGTANADDNDPNMARVEQFLLEQLMRSGVAPEDIDIDVFPPAAALDTCQHSEPFLPRNDTRLMGRVSVGLRCGAEAHRVRYLQAELHVHGERVIAARDIAPGEMIRANMLTTERVDLGRLPAQSVTDLNAAIGQQARRPLRQGQGLSAYALSAPQLVERGQRVSIEANGRGFRIRRQGEALDNGAQGDIVRIRMANREIVEAQITGPGALTVAF